MNKYDIRYDADRDEWYVYADGWIASFAEKQDAELFVKIKQINEILTA